MRIALCFSGQPRGLEKSYSVIKDSIIGDYDIDVFMHFWKGAAPVDPSDPNIDDMKVTQDPEVFKKAVELYSPKLWLFENQPDFSCNQYFTETYGQDWQQYGVDFPINDLKLWVDYKDRLFNTYGDRPHNMISQLTSWKQANQLKKTWEQVNGFKYDCVIRMRSDFVMDASIVYEKIDLDNLYVIGGQHDCQHHASKGDSFAINDWFGISSSEVMDYYAELIDHMPYYYYKDKIRCVVEVMLGWHIKKKNIPITKLNVHSAILREK